MRLLLLLVLALGLAAALPQERRRGSRRFALVSPGLLPATRGRAEPEQGVETAAAPERGTPTAPEPRRTRGRTSSRLRGSRTSPKAEPSQEPAISETPAIEKAHSESKPNRAGGRLRLRKPIKKVVPSTTTTTTTTTTAPATSAPEPEKMMDKLKKVKVEAPQKPMPEKVGKKEMAKPEAEPVPEQEAAVPELVSEAPKVKVSKGLPRPKLRPIPIKIGSRGNAAKAPEVKPIEPETPEDQESTPSVSSPVSSHRFSSRQKGSRVQLRGRGSRGRPSEVEPRQEQTETADQPADTQPSRTRGSGAGRRFSRITPRRRISSAARQETPEEETPNAEEASATQPPQRRFPNLKELKTIIGHDDTDLKPKSKLKRRNIGRPRLQRPTPLTGEKLPETVEEVVDKQKRIEETVLEPLSDVKRKIVKLDEKDYTQLEVRAAVTTATQTLIKVPTPVKVEMVPVEITARVRPTTRASIEVPAPVQTTTSVPVEVQDAVQRPDQALIPSRVAPASRSRQAKPLYRESNRSYRGRDSSTKLIGTVEDTPPDEVRRILSGLGSRRRGLSRSQVTEKTSQRIVDDAAPAASTHHVEEPLSDADYLYDYYDYPMDERTV